MEKIIKVLNEATDKLSEIIRKDLDKQFPQVCEAQQRLLELLIDLKPTYGLE